MLQRIRNCFGIDAAETDPNNDNKLGVSGVVVGVDETIHGGKAKNMSNIKRKAIREDRAIQGDNKTNIVGYLERGSKLRLQAIKPTDFIPDLVRIHLVNKGV